MTSLRSLLFVLPAAAIHCFGQCNPHPLRPSMLPPCPTVLDQLSKAMDASAEFKKDVGVLNNQTGDARTRFWKLFPNGPGIDAAEADFLKMLWNKDMYYLMFSLPEGVSGRTAMMPNVIGMDLSTTSQDLSSFPKNVDGGIRPYAFPMFVQWVNALRRSEGRDKDGLMASPLLIAKAVQDKSNWRKAYEHARNWAEFMSSGVDISKHLTPQAYLLNQMEGHVSLALAASKPADLLDPAAATRELYNLFVKMFGEKDVLAAAATVLHTPKNSVGGLAKRADVEVGLFVSAPSPNPYMLFLTEVTKSSPHNYAVALCMDPYALLGGQATTTFNTKEQWAKAFSVYTQVAAKYGEATVLSAAARLKDVPKGTDGPRGDPMARGTTWWFQALLKDPKTVVPEVGRFMAGSYDPRWIGNMVEVRGTVSRVDVAKGKHPEYATMHFKESRDDRLTGFTPNSGLLQESYGENFEGLIGKPVEIWGQVDEWREGGGVRLLITNQVKVIDAAALTNFKESHPEWLTAARPAEVLVDSPKYLAWKKFPTGTKVTLEDRLLMETRPGTDQYNRSRISRTTFQLQSIDADRAVVTWDSTTWPMRGGETQSSDKLTYKAKERPGTAQVPLGFAVSDGMQTTTGEETLVINGKKIATWWECIASAKDPQTFTKTWRSDEVPGGLVLQHVRQGRTSVNTRNFSETIWAPVDGVVPELGESSVQAPTANVAQPAGTNRDARAAGTVRRPDAKTAPTTPVPTAPVPAAPPVSRGRANPPMNQPPAASGQSELAQRYMSAMRRVGQAKVGLAQLQRRQSGSGANLPDDIRAASDRLDTQLRNTVLAMRARDNGATEQSFHALEDTLAVIEKYLAK